MQNLPTAEVYEKENRYMPWGLLMKEVQGFVDKTAPQNGSVLDLLCGPGYLLGQIQRQRPDLHMTGVDLEPEFIDYAKKQYSGIHFIVADAVEWMSVDRYDLVLVTGGLHHLCYDQQELFLKKVSCLLNDGGTVIMADPYIDDYDDEDSRKCAAAKLGYEYLIATMGKGAPHDVIDAAIGILKNDVLGIEFKSSIQKVKPMFEKYFPSVQMCKTWPTEKTEYGDYYFVLRNNKNEKPR